MNDDEIRDALRVIERPGAVAPELVDRVLRAMLDELAAEQPAPVASSRRRRRAQPWLRSPSLGIAASLVVTMALVLAAVVVTTRSAPSALAAMQEARAQFRSLPAYHARTTVSDNDRGDSPDFETRWETEDWYRDRDTWRTTILTTNTASAGQPGDYQVLADGRYGEYKAENNVFTVTPVADRDDGRPRSPAFWFDPDLQWWPTDTPAGGRPSEEFFEKNCSTRDTTYLGREARKLHCPAPVRAIDLWLDKETGMLLRISVFDVIREITSIEFNPEVPPGTYAVQTPEGAKKRWGGKGTPPPEYRVALGSEVAARYRVVDGDTSGIEVAAVGRSGIWLGVIRCGQGCDHELHRVDPRTGKVLATIEPPDRAFIDDVVELDGQIWASMTARSADGQTTTATFLQQIDVPTGRLSGPRILTGGSGGVLAVDGELWSTGGLTRTVTIGPAMTEYKQVARVNPATGQVTQIELAGGAIGTPIAGDGLIWVPTSQLDEQNPYQTDYAVVGIDPKTNAVVRRLTAPGYPQTVAFSGGRLYASFEVMEGASRRGLIGVADAEAAGFRTAQIARGEAGLSGVLAAGSLWIRHFEQGAVLKVDPLSLRVTATIATGRGPTGIGVGLGSVWVADFRDGTLARIDVE